MPLPIRACLTFDINIRLDFDGLTRSGCEEFVVSSRDNAPLRAGQTSAPA
jgi:hypothetical protein